MKKLKLFFSHRQNRLAVFMVASIILVAIAAPMLAPVEVSTVDPAFQQIKGVKDIVPIPPNKLAPLGTIPVAQRSHLNVYYNVIWGMRSALRFGLTVVIITAVFGVFVGAISAYVGGRFNSLVMRITDAFLAFPLIAGVVFFSQLMRGAMTFGEAWFISGGWMGEFAGRPLQVFLAKIDPLMLALILLSWMAYARITNSAVMSVKQSDYILAARALGIPPFRIIRRHLLPNSISPSIVLATREIGGVVLLQATFTFIGIAGGSEWGTSLAMGQQWIIGPGGNIMRRWWTFLPVTFALVYFGVAWNLLGDSLNDWLNPRIK